jgi:hypothetical protein
MLAAEAPCGHRCPACGRTVGPNGQAAAQNDEIGAAQMEMINQPQVAPIGGYRATAAAWIITQRDRHSRAKVILPAE